MLRVLPRPGAAVPGPGVITRAAAIANELVRPGVECSWQERRYRCMSSVHEAPVGATPSPRLQLIAVRRPPDQEEALTIESQGSIHEAGKMRRPQQCPIGTIPAPGLDGGGTQARHPLKEQDAGGDRVVPDRPGLLRRTGRVRAR